MLTDYTEQGAFRALEEHLKKAQEAATAVGINLSDGRWTTVATMLSQMLLNVQHLRSKGHGNIR